MSTESKLEAWKKQCTKREIMNWFVEKDHYKLGLDNGCTINQLMNDIGFRNPVNDHSFEVMAKFHLRNTMNSVRKAFFLDGFILSSKKLRSKTPTVYFLIDNLSGERVERHYSLKKRAEKSTEKFRNDKLDVLELIPKVKDPKTKALFEKAYSSRLSINPLLLSDGKRKKATKLLEK